MANILCIGRGGEVANTAVCRTAIRGCKSRSRLIVRMSEIRCRRSDSGFRRSEKRRWFLVSVETMRLYQGGERRAGEKVGYGTAVLGIFTVGVGALARSPGLVALGVFLTAGGLVLESLSGRSK